MILRLALVIFMTALGGVASEIVVQECHVVTESLECMTNRSPTRNGTAYNTGTFDLTTKMPPTTTTIMPPKVRSMLHRDWSALDPRGEGMLRTMSKLSATVEFAHARDTFYGHLEGTFALLAAWNQPEELNRAGLVHTAYSGDLFQFYLFRGEVQADREELTSIIGAKAEHLTWLFGTIYRGMLCNFKDVVNREVFPASPIEGPVMVPHRINGEIEMSEREIANILMITIADYMDQMVDTNGWRDHHQVENPDVLYPGDGRPAVVLYWMSTIANVIAEHLEVVPPIFDNCTSVIAYEDELIARDAYWRVVSKESELDVQEQMDLLLKCIKHNPFIGEPHSLLAQIHFRFGRFEEAADHASMGLSKMYSLATAWDKRRSYGSWVGFARMLALRSQRRMEGIESLPTNPEMAPSAAGRPLVSLREVVNEMEERGI